MSETLRDLVVSLSLDSDNFTRNIKSVNKQIQEAESRFKLAAAGVENFESTTEGLTTKLDTLNRRLKLQQDVVGQYERALAAAETKLGECSNREIEYAHRLDTARKAHQALKEQVRLLKLVIEEEIVLGKFHSGKVVFVDHLCPEYVQSGEEPASS